MKTIKTKVIMFLILQCFLSSCQAISGMNHFEPPSGTEYGVEFNYPDDWEIKCQDEPLSISLYDPLRALPTPSRQHSPISDIAFVHLSADTHASPGKLDETIDWYFEATEAIGGVVLEDRTIVIDGVVARWISSSIPARRGLNDFEMYSVDIFFYASEKFYYLSLSVPLDEKDGEFARGFDRLVQSIEFVP